MKEFRAAIIRMHERGTGKREIGRLLGIDESTVRKAIKRFEETGSNDNRKRELEPSRLLHLVDSRRKSMLEATPELGIVEKSAKEGMERNHFGDSDQDSR